MRARFNPRLHLVTDRALCCGRPLADIVAAAARGGVSVVQLREKQCSTREFYQLATALHALLRGYDIPLIINDRTDIALAVGAEGLHVGQSDIPHQVARELLGEKAIIGLSVESLADAQAAEKADVDYLGLSPIYATPTKTDTKEPLGLAGIKAIRAISERPLVAIGGISAVNAAQVLASGADGIAVVSAICSAADPQAATRELQGLCAG